MTYETLVPGLKFSVEHNLTNKDLKVLLLLVGKEMTTAELGEQLSQPTGAVHHTIMRLRLKDMIQMVGKTVAQEIIYGIK